MAKKNTEKQLVLDTLNFFIKQRNIALFKLNDLQSKKDLFSGERENARKVVENLRIRLTREYEKHKHLLSSEERGLFIKENESND